MPRPVCWAMSGDFRRFYGLEVAVEWGKMWGKSYRAGRKKLGSTIWQKGPPCSHKMERPETHAIQGITKGCTYRGKGPPCSHKMERPEARAIQGITKGCTIWQNAPPQSRQGIRPKRQEERETGSPKEDGPLASLPFFYMAARASILEFISTTSNCREALGIMQREWILHASE